MQRRMIEKTWQNMLKSAVARGRGSWWAGAEFIGHAATCVQPILGLRSISRPRQTRFLMPLERAPCRTPLAGEMRECGLEGTQPQNQT
jgi:hypothetical protein